MRSIVDNGNSVFRCTFCVNQTLCEDVFELDRAFDVSTQVACLLVATPHFLPVPSKAGFYSRPFPPSTRPSPNNARTPAKPEKKPSVHNRNMFLPMIAILDVRSVVVVLPLSFS